jgi:hypothetical protein
LMSSPLMAILAIARIAALVSLSASMYKMGTTSSRGGEA